MTVFKNNIILIGMPGAGKSTIGSSLAKMLEKNFVDTDLLIQEQQGKTLQDIVDNEGHLTLRAIEEKTLLCLNEQNHVIATGGSAVYSEAAMLHFKTIGTIIFLDVELPEIVARISNFDTRGLARRADQTFSELFNERRPLYQQYADICINCTDKTPEIIIKEIISLQEYS